MAAANNPPDISATAFACPHCGAYTTQHWFRLAADRLHTDSKLPVLVDEEFVKRLASKNKSEDESVPEELKSWFKTLSTQVVALYRESQYFSFVVGNLHLAQCFNCNNISIWVYKSLIFPSAKSGDQANADIPSHIRLDYDEARSICTISPRGAAALLRLCIQKLCVYLGEPGKNLNSDIASLVSKGLNPTVQKALDIVRVVGNEAVHPGVMDLKDDYATVSRLFGLVNVITEQMITLPAHVKSLYETLPEDKRKAIEERDNKSNG